MNEGFSLNTDSLRNVGYSFNRTELAKDPLLASEWVEFKDSWNSLEPDRYLNSSIPYRFRRFGAFDYSCLEGILQHKRDQAFCQTSAEVDKLYEGKERVFAPLSTGVSSCQTLRVLIDADIKTFSSLAREPRRNWMIGAHQIRVVGGRAADGLPSPEGIHRDGYCFVVIRLITASNLGGGVSRIYDGNRRLIKEVAMRHPGETIFINDNKLFHEVTPVYPLDRNKGNASRDVLIFSYDKA